MQMRMTLMAVLGLAFTTQSLAIAAPIFNPETQHFYELVVDTNGLIWGEAKTAAESMTLMGVNGHLATITSQAENDFIMSNLVPLAPAPIVFLGGFQPNGSAEPNGDWMWVTGEAWSYTDWATNPIQQPDDAGGVEDVLETHSSGGWNDIWDQEVRQSYIVEYPIPEPLSLSLIVVGSLVALVRFRGA